MRTLKILALKFGAFIWSMWLSMANATTITYPVDVTIRDFHQIHDDFQFKVSQLDPGHVGTTLLNGVPVWNGANDGSDGAVNNATTFSSWYADCDPNTPESTCVAEYTVPLNATVDLSTG